MRMGSMNWVVGMRVRVRMGGVTGRLFCQPSQPSKQAVSDSCPKPYPTLMLLSQSNCSTVTHHLYSCSAVFGQFASICMCTNFLDASIGFKQKLSWLQIAETVGVSLPKIWYSPLVLDTFFFHHLLFPSHPSWSRTLLTWLTTTTLLHPIPSFPAAMLS